MECEEPATGLVLTFGDEVGRIEAAVVDEVFVLEWVVELCIRHSTAVEPHVDEVEFTLHWLAAFAHEHDVVNVWTVQVNLIVVFVAVIANHETSLLPWVLSHHASCHGFLHFVVEFFHAADTNFFVCVGIAPDRKWSAPVAAAAQVPVVEVFEPFAEAACAGVLRFPLNGLVEFHHAVATSSRADKPAVEWIVEDRLVGTPAVWIVVGVLLHLEGGAVLLHANADVDVEVFSLVGSLFIVAAIHGVFWVVGVLNVCASVFLV